MDVGGVCETPVTLFKSTWRHTPDDIEFSSTALQVPKILESLSIKFKQDTVLFVLRLCRNQTKIARKYDGITRWQ
jgi:uncharacterized protein YgfB (UPF0149 family)